MSYQDKRFRGKQRDAIFEEDGWACAYCLMDLRDAPRVMRTVDHIVPRRWGGTNARANLLTACHPCNSRRRDMPLARFVGTETLVRLVRDYPRVAATIVSESKDQGHQIPGRGTGSAGLRVIR